MKIAVHLLVLKRVVFSRIKVRQHNPKQLIVCAFVKYMKNNDCRLEIGIIIEGRRSFVIFTKIYNTVKCVPSV